MSKKINGYKVELIGQGGNASVFKAKKNKGEFCALKRLDDKTGNEEKKARFIREATFGKSYPDLVEDKIILPVFEFNNTDECIYYTMPLCYPIQKFKFNNLREKCDAIKRLLYKLLQLHERGLAHRDIKPENILVYNGDFYFSDFGLLFIEKEERITKPQSNERIGAKRTIAPEMERNQSYNANKFKADIYSMAKTIWMILTDNYECFEGQYSAYSTIALSNFETGTFRENTIEPQLPYYALLDETLNLCTDHDPDKRLDAQKLLGEFEKWVDVNENFAIRNIIQWEETLHKIFPEGIPRKAEWDNIDDIIKIINILSEYNGLVYAFLPRGGMHIQGAKIAYEDGFIELNLGSPTLYPVKSLTFYSIGGEAGWNYFRLDPLDSIKPIFENGDDEAEVDDETEVYEELTELSPGYFGPYQVFEDNKSYKGFSPTKDMRIIQRFYRGSILFFNTKSPYNKVSSTQGRHSEFTKEEFEFYIQGCYEKKYDLRYSEYEIYKAKEDFYKSKQDIVK